MAEKETNFWQKISAISGLIAAVIIPVVLAFVGNMYTQAIKEREIQGRYVELALDILKSPPDDKNQHVRSWALKVVDRYSGVPLDSDAKNELKTAPLLPPAPVVIFDNTNKEGVSNHPDKPTKFAISKPHIITFIRTYHWNNGKGSTPGKISLEHEDGTIYGPWIVTASSGHNDAPNVNWFTRPNVTIPPGVYTVIDSEPKTWSKNAKSGGGGFALVQGHPK